MSLLLLANGVPEPLSLLPALSIVYANTLELLLRGHPARGLPGDVPRTPLMVATLPPAAVP